MPLNAAPVQRFDASPRLLVMLLFLLTLCVYWPVSTCGFIDFDDPIAVTDNPHIREGLNLRAVRWAFTTTYYDYWHPLPWLTHALDVSVYGMSPGGHHLTSLLLHAVNVVLLFLLLNSMTARRWESAAVAAIFAVHPVHVESVAWIVERKDLLSGLFFFSMLLLYARYARTGRRGFYALALLSYALGLMSKPMLVTAPLLMLLLDRWPLGRPMATYTEVRRLIVEKVPFVALACASALATYITTDRIGSVSHDVPYAVRAAVAANAYLAYLGKLVWPTNLAVLYPYPTDLYRWHVAVSAAVLLAVTVAALLARKRGYITVGWLWFVIGLLPVIGFVKIGFQYMADRFLYLPAIGIYVAAVWAAGAFLRAHRRWHAPVVALLGIVVALLALATARQISYWRDSISLFQHAANTTSGNAIMHGNLGAVLQKAGRTQEALVHLNESLRIAPTYFRAWLALAGISRSNGDLKQATVYATKALAAKPDFTDARLLLAQLALSAGDEAAARTHLADALRHDSTAWQAHSDLGVLEQKRGNLEAASRCYAAALRICPEAAAPLTNMGLLLLAEGRPADALPYLQRSAAVSVDVYATFNALGVALLRTGDPARAEVALSRAIAIAPRTAQARANRALARFVMGKVQEGERDCLEAAALDPTFACKPPLSATHPVDGRAK